MNLQIAYNAYTNSEGGYAAIIVIPLPPLSDTFPADDVISFFTGKGVAVESLPSYATTSGKFLADADSTGVKVEIFGSNSEEASAYATLLTNNGWTVDTAASDAEKHLTVLMYGETLARCQIGDFSAEAGNHEVVIVFDLKTWTEDDLKFFEENLGGIVPPYTDAGIDYDYFESNGQIWSYDTLTADEFAAYVEAALKDGWVEKTQGTTKVYEKVGEKGYAWFYYNGGYIRYMYFQTAWTDDQLAAFATHLGVELPFLEEFSGLEWDDETESFSDYLYPEDCSAAVAAELEGWEASEPEVITEGDAPGTYYTFTKDSSLGGKAVVQLRVYAYSTTYPAVTQIAVYHDEGGDVPPVEDKSLKVTFTNEISTTAADAATAFGWFTADGLSSVISGVSATNFVYAGAAGGGTGNEFSVANSLKVGKASAGGSITIALPSGVSVTKVVIEGYGWKSSLVVTVNEASSLEGAFVVAGKESCAGDPSVVEFEFSEAQTGSLTISTNNTAVIITSITVYYSVAN